eukprot:TRINITY_DN4771_c0_g1_i1.p1 TRINITY_DN4771_c0_g1~~TRINITY_DN4771_c0_g1_i1.p1  ORF type:complete len:451 (+),score=133.87 TRINITY_DN4771_c0_g1_i1:83-1435(+)
MEEQKNEIKDVKHYLKESQKNIIKDLRSLIQIADVKNGYIQTKIISGRELLDKLEKLREKAKVNSWYTLEAKIKRSIVNICGKFEADLRNSNVFLPDLGGYDFPEFKYSRSEIELGEIVKEWVKNNPSGEIINDNKKSPFVPRNNETNEEKERRKEESERRDLEEETKLGIKRVDVEVDFRNWGVLNKKYILAHLDNPNENIRERVGIIITKILNSILVLGRTFGIRFIFKEINLSNTEASMRSIFNGEDWNGRIMYREREIVMLNLSNTRTTPKSLQNLSKAIRLEYLFVDRCNMNESNNKENTVDIFESDVQKVPGLKVLSLVDTSKQLSPNWLSRVEEVCPNLHLIYFNKTPKEKVVGWVDNVLMKSMINPTLLECGHIIDAETLKKLEKKERVNCRKPIKESLSISNFTIELTKVNDQWNSQLLNITNKTFAQLTCYTTFAERLYL